jgi:sterol desaturase/sphingolipid hydroxylase (fatty acid hydroxylase superfamily)
LIVAIIVQLVFFALFGLLARLWPDQRGQAWLRQGLLDDVVYFLLSVLLYGQLFHWLSAHAADLGWAGAASEHARRAAQDAIRRQPLALQLAAFLLAYDFMQYWLHRASHMRAVWRFHGVHHSATEIDVLTSFRWHPFNLFVYIGVPTFATTALGFSPQVFLIAALLNLVLSALSHANLSWTWGPLRYVVVSPMFHRWHHARLPGGASCNYAPNFPVWDLMFGTFHMPVGERPAAYGYRNAPQGVARQLAYPFARPSAERARSAPQARDQGGGGGVVAQGRPAL